MTSYTTNSAALVAVERERRRRRAARSAPLERCRGDCAYFIDEFVIIDDAQGHGEGLGTMPFHLWPSQSELLESLSTDRLLLILKARQLGISWLVCAYVLWLCLFRPSRLVLMFSIGQDEANELMRRVSVMYHRLPESLKAALPALKRDNTEVIGWANGSRVESKPATQNAGSGYTASLIVLDEFAKVRWAKELYTAVKPTIDGGGQMVILSSANGEGGLFHDLCSKAQKGLGRFVLRFLPWWAHPERDAQWYAATEADAASAALMRQEYPATPEEAFQATNDERFLPSIAMWDACREELPALGPREPLVIGVDAGLSSDCFACIGVSPHPQDHTRSAVRLAHIWEPKGHLLDFDAIEQALLNIISSYNVLCIAYDPFLLAHMMDRLSQRVWCEAFGQAGPRLEADKGLLDAIQRREIAHDGDLLLGQHLDNADRKTDPETRKLRIVKRAQNLKVDGAVALSMALHQLRSLNL